MFILELTISIGFIVFLILLSLSQKKAYNESMNLSKLSVQLLEDIYYEISKLNDSRK